MPPIASRVCITGGAGFIGSHLVERLIGDYEIVVYDNLHRNALQFARAGIHDHPRLRVVRGDVMDYESVRRAIEGCEAVIHCAAIAGVYSVDRNAVTPMEVNLLGTHHVVKAALEWSSTASVVLVILQIFAGQLLLLALFPPVNA